MSEKKPLTKVQKEVFDYVKGFIRENGISPCMREIQQGLDYESTSPVHKHVQTLCKKGYLKKTPKVWRGIEVLEA
jgi:repressor LexA